MAKAAVVGIGMIPFGKHEDRTLVGMAAEACRLALKDAGIKPSRVDAAFFASGLASKLFGDFTVGQNVFWEVGINRIPVINVENACTSGSTAFYLGYNMVAAGQAETVLVCGAEKMCVPGFGLISSGETQLDTQLGMVAPAGFALRAVRHMAEYGTTKEQLGQRGGQEPYPRRSEPHGPVSGSVDRGGSACRAHDRGSVDALSMLSYRGWSRRTVDRVAFGGGQAGTGGPGGEFGSGHRKL